MSGVHGCPYHASPARVCARRSEGLFNDVRSAGSEKISWYVEAATKVATSRGRDAFEPIGMWFTGHWADPQTRFITFFIPAEVGAGAARTKHATAPRPKHAASTVTDGRRVTMRARAGPVGCVGAGHSDHHRYGARHVHPRARGAGPRHVVVLRWRPDVARTQPGAVLAGAVRRLPTGQARNDQPGCEGAHCQLGGGFGRATALRGEVAAERRVRLQVQGRSPASVHMLQAWCVPREFARLTPRGARTARGTRPCGTSR